MTYKEFVGIVGSVSLFTGDSEYDDILRAYQKSSLDKIDFLTEWRQRKVEKILKQSPPRSYKISKTIPSMFGKFERF